MQQLLLFTFLNKNANMKSIIKYEVICPLSSSDSYVETIQHLEFSDNRLLSLLFGERDQYLARIEQTAGVTIVPRGNQLVVKGPPAAVSATYNTLKKLYKRLQKGMIISASEVDAVLRLELSEKGEKTTSKGTSSTEGSRSGGDITITTKSRTVKPRTTTQQKYMKALQQKRVNFGVGPAGTGKTYLAVATAVGMLLNNKVDRIILSRPAVEAGERLGFLPGDLREKIDPYLRPLYDALYDMIPGEQVIKFLSSGQIEIAPLAFMRGRTLSNSFVILDEAQNTTRAQMKMLLTRLGEGSYMSVNGDLTQIDLPQGEISGLEHAVHLLKDIDDIAVTIFDRQDVIRDPIVAKIVGAYEGTT